MTDCYDSVHADWPTELTLYGPKGLISDITIVHGQIRLIVTTLDRLTGLIVTTLYGQTRLIVTTLYRLTGLIVTTLYLPTEQLLRFCAGRRD